MLPSIPEFSVFVQVVDTETSPALGAVPRRAPLAASAPHLAPNPPPDPHPKRAFKERAFAPRSTKSLPVLPMDKQALRMDIWTTLQVDHMSTLRRQLAHRGLPSAMRASLAHLFKSTNTGDGLVPPDCRMVRG
jgi:hypothetical protein